MVLRGGATAVFRVPSLGEAAQLAEAVAHTPGLDGSEALLTIGDDRLRVRLSRKCVRLEERHIVLGRALSATARRYGAVADRPCVHEVQVAIATSPTRSMSLLTRCPRVRKTGRRQRRRPARPRLDVVDSGAQRGQAPPARDESRRLRRSRARRGACGGGACRRRPHRRRRHAPGAGFLADRAGNRVRVTAWPDGSVSTAPADPLAGPRRDPVQPRARRRHLGHPPTRTRPLGDAPQPADQRPRPDRLVCSAAHHALPIDWPWATPGPPCTSAPSDNQYRRPLATAPSGNQGPQWKVGQPGTVMPTSPAPPTIADTRLTESLSWVRAQRSQASIASAVCGS